MEKNNVLKVGYRPLLCHLTAQNEVIGRGAITIVVFTTLPETELTKDSDLINDILSNLVHLAGKVSQDQVTSPVKALGFYREFLKQNGVMQ